jgi:hypothetical protein
MPTFILTTPVPVGSPGQAAWTDAAIVIGGDAWRLLGNAGTNPAINFIGTTDAQDLVFRTNNAERLRFLDTGEFGLGGAPVPGIGGIISYPGSGVLLDSTVAGTTSLGFREPNGGLGVSSFTTAPQGGVSYSYTLPATVPDPGPVDPGDMGIGIMEIDGATPNVPVMAWRQSRTYTVDSTTTGTNNWAAGLPAILAASFSTFLFDLPGTAEFDTVELGLQQKYISGNNGFLTWMAAISPGGGELTLTVFNHNPGGASTGDLAPQISVRVTRS